MKARVLLLLAVAACLCCLPAAHAGCRKRKAVVPESERFFNHQPVEKLPYESLPASFSWRNKDGINFLAPSWNQHIVSQQGNGVLPGEGQGSRRWPPDLFKLQKITGVSRLFAA